ATLFRDAAVVLAQLETPYDTVVAALRAGRANGATTLLNPAPAPAPTLDAAARDARLGLADVLTPNEAEFASLANASGAPIAAEAVAGMDEAALHALCRKLLPGGTVVVTLGSAGAFISHRDDDRRGDARNCYRLPAERVAAIDTTGAGDAFNG